MAKILHPQFSFTAGQLDANLSQRGDLEAYYKGLKKAENCVLRVVGGVTRRYGTKFVRTAPDGTKFRIIDYTARANGADYTNIIVFGNNIADVFNVESGHYLTSFVTGKTDEVMSKCDYEMDGNKIIFTEENTAPFQISFTGGSASSASTYTVSDVDLSNIPYYEFVANDFTPTGAALTPSAVSGYITLTASAGTPFQGVQPGMKVRITPVGYVRIISVKSDTLAVGFVERHLSSTDPIAAGSWLIEKGWEPIISATRGWPRTLAFYAGRLYFGGTRALPNLIMASTVEDNYDFDLGDASDSDGFYEFTDSKDAAHIYMLQSRNTLEIYCNASVYVITTSGFIGPVSVKITRVSPNGIMPYAEAPLISDGGSLFLNNDKNGVYWTNYQLESDSYLCDLISELCSDMITVADMPVTYPTVVWKGDDNFKNNFFAFINEDHELVLASILLREQVKGFSKLIFQERDAEGNFVKSKLLCICPVKDKFFMILYSRQRDSYDLLYWDKNSYLDNSTTASVSGQIIAGLNRYEGSCVDVINKDSGEYLGPYPVNSNQIDLETNVYDGAAVEVGYAFYMTIETMPIEDIQNLGSSIGKYKNISEVFVNPEEVSNMTLNGHKMVDTTNKAPVTEPFVNRTLYGWDRQKTLVISQDKPMSLSLRNILVKAEVNE